VADEVPPVRAVQARVVEGLERAPQRALPQREAAEGGRGDGDDGDRAAPLRLEVRAQAGQVRRVVEVALGANLQADLALSGPGTVIVTYAAAPPDPVLPVRACMSANVTLRFVLLYTVPAEAVDQAVADIGNALREGALTPLPVHRFRLDDIATAHEAVEDGVTGKVLLLIGD